MTLPLVLVCLVAGQTPAAPPPPMPLAHSLVEMPEASRRAYKDAVAQLTQGDFHSATVALNALAAEHPAVAELYAARCTAQLSLARYATAEADCAYALRLNAALVDARYGLAAAEDGQGKRDAAAWHYREYAASREPNVRPELRARAEARAAALFPPAPVARPEAAPARPRETECRMGSDGRQACGYNCRMGSDGVMACANTPDGVCAMGSNGHVTCSTVATSASPGQEPPRCHMGSDGRQSCGYNCRFGSNGHWYCASVPNGRCGMNSDGSFTCP